jgi:ApaG protein
LQYTIIHDTFIIDDIISGFLHFCLKVIFTNMTSTSPAPVVTRGVKVGVFSTYIPPQSSPNMNYFVHSYDITLENTSSSPVQLLTRHWDVFDSGNHHVVDGDGVIGEQPVLAPGDIYRYQSGTVMNSRSGRMEGWYTFIDLVDESEFRVMIPTFACEVSADAWPVLAPVGAA